MDLKEEELIPNPVNSDTGNKPQAYNQSHQDAQIHPMKYSKFGSEFDADKLEVRRAKRREEQSRY